MLLLLNNMKRFPFAAPEPEPEDDCSREPVHTHRQCNADHSHMEDNAKKYRQDQPHPNSGKQGNAHGKSHISCRTQSFSKRICKWKNDRICNVMDQYQPDPMHCPMTVIKAGPMDELMRAATLQILCAIPFAAI